MANEIHAILEGFWSTDIDWNILNIPKVTSHRFPIFMFRRRDLIEIKFPGIFLAGGNKLLTLSYNYINLIVLNFDQRWWFILLLFYVFEAVVILIINWNLQCFIFFYHILLSSINKYSNIIGFDALKIQKLLNIKKLLKNSFKILAASF